MCNRYWIIRSSLLSRFINKLKVTDLPSCMQFLRSENINFMRDLYKIIYTAKLPTNSMCFSVPVCDQYTSSETKLMSKLFFDESRESRPGVFKEALAPELN